jgi:tripartite-type tricarboxylate transporter receptor subunit TctC
MGEAFGQRIVVDNVMGAGGVVGARRVARSAADGHTMLIFNTALISIPAFSKTADIDPLRDLAPVGLINESPFVLVARPNYPADDAPSLLARLKIEGDRTRVGLVNLFCAQTADAISNVQARTVKGYLVIGPNRLAQLSPLPAVSELLLTSGEMTVWHGLFLPPGTSPAISRRIEMALAAALDSPRVKDRFAAFGLEPTPFPRRGPAAFSTLVDAEVRRWQSLVGDMVIVPE